MARTTIASAFQRTSAESRDSISRLPWYGGCSSRPMVFTYGRREHARQRHAAHAGVLQQAAQQEGGAAAALGGDDRVERVDPLAGLERVGVGEVGRPGDVRFHGLEGLVREP